MLSPVVYLSNVTVQSSSINTLLGMHAVGVVCLGPLLGRSATAPPHQQRLLLSAMILLDAVAGLWILLQYAFEVITIHVLLPLCTQPFTRSGAQ